jgi:hypothetical protein
LLIAHEEIAPGEKIKQFPVAPEISPILALVAAGFDE